MKYKESFETENVGKKKAMHKALEKKKGKKDKGDGMEQDQYIKEYAARKK